MQGPFDGARDVLGQVLDVGLLEGGLQLGGELRRRCSGKLVNLKRPVSGADEELCKYLDRLADETITTLDQDASFTNKLRRVIWIELSDGVPTLQHTSGTLGISTRALQRRLSEEGTTFTTVLRDLRREVAMGLIRHREMAVCEIAYLLGYAEPSTFHRAFRRWTGTSPREYRRTMT